MEDRLQNFLAGMLFGIVAWSLLIFYLNISWIMSWMPSWISWIFGSNPIGQAAWGTVEVNYCAGIILILSFVYGIVSNIPSEDLPGSSTVSGFSLAFGLPTIIITIVAGRFPFFILLH